MKEKQILLWCLYDFVKGERFDGLTEGEVRLLVSQLSSEERLNHLVWQEGWKEWKVVSHVSEILKPVERELKSTPPNISDKFRKDNSAAAFKSLYQGNEVNTEQSMAVEAVTVSDIPDLPIEKEGAEFIPRTHKRLKRCYEILIDCNGQQFKTNSVDVSVGGVLLKDPLPDWVFGYCTITIIKPGTHESVQLTCSIVENQSPDSRFRVALSPPKRKEDQRRLHAWLSAA